MDLERKGDALQTLYSGTMAGLAKRGRRLISYLGKRWPGAHLTSPHPIFGGGDRLGRPRLKSYTKLFASIIALLTNSFGINDEGVSLRCQLGMGISFSLQYGIIRLT